MEGYFETIESKGGGIVGSAAELFWTAWFWAPGSSDGGFLMVASSLLLYEM